MNGGNENDSPKEIGQSEWCSAKASKAWRSSPGGTPWKFGWGVCGPPLETLRLFQTKIHDFPYPISDLTQNSIPYFVCLNI